MKKIIFLFLIMLCALSIEHCEAQWVVLNSGTNQNLNSVFFINVQTGYTAGVSGIILKTTNGGSNWIVLNSGVASELRSIHFFNPTTGIICGYNGTIIRTTNGGNNWTATTSGTTQHLMGISFSNDSIGICGGNSGTQLYSTNGGVNWNVGSPTGYLVTLYSAFMVNPTTGYCFGVNTIFSCLVAKTTNGGVNFTYSGFMVNNNEATLEDAYFFDAQNGLAVSNLWNNTGGISRTTNGGVNWTSQTFSYGIFGIDFPNSSIGYCVGLNGYILKSIDGGNNWIQQLSGSSASLSSIDFVDSVNGYAAGSGGTILKTTNGGVTSIHEKGYNVPDKFELYQNFPNPFNPVTKIKYQIANNKEQITNNKEQITNNIFVTLRIYDILGRLIKTLVNEKKLPGMYEVTFDGSKLTSGIYFYQLIAGEYNVVKKMILLK